MPSCLSCSLSCLSLELYDLRLHCLELCPELCLHVLVCLTVELLPQCDFVVSATASPNYTLQIGDLSPLVVDHGIYLIDLAVPRDIDPLSRQLEWVTLYDIDSFNIDPMSDKLLAAMKKAQLILNEEEARFYTWYEGKDFVPQIQRLKSAVGSDVSARMTPALRRARLDEDKKNRISREAAGASERMLNHLLFGMRSRTRSSGSAWTPWSMS